MGKIMWNKRVERSLNTGADKTGSIIQRIFHIKQNSPGFLFKMSISKKYLEKVIKRASQVEGPKMGQHRYHGGHAPHSLLLVGGGECF